MELGNIEETRFGAADAKYAEAIEEQGEEVVLNMRHSDGSPIGSLRAKVGATVAWVKMVVAQQHAEALGGVGMDRVVLKAGGRTLLDPLSLSDCPGFRPGAQVEVEVSTS